VPSQLTTRARTLVTKENLKMTDLLHQCFVAPDEPPVGKRKHHRLRWVIVGFFALLVMTVVGLFLFSDEPAPAPLTLPKQALPATGSSNTSIDGTWTIGQGSLAGYRVQEKVAGFSDTVVGRTSTVTGTVDVVHGEVTSASFRVDLTTVTANGKTQPRLASIMDTTRYPDAIFTLTKPIAPGATLSANRPFTVYGTGLLAMHGKTRSVTLAIAARYNGSVLEAAGSTPITFSGWNIQAPSYGSLISLQNHAVVEFSIVLHR
jgi:polyisoprenoid-binding protein YceI